MRQLDLTRAQLRANVSGLSEDHGKMRSEFDAFNKAQVDHTEAERALQAELLASAVRSAQAIAIANLSKPVHIPVSKCTSSTVFSF